MKYETNMFRVCTVSRALELWMQAKSKYYLGKVNGYPNGIGLKNIFRNFLLEKKKITNFFYNFLYFL